MVNSCTNSFYLDVVKFMLHHLTPRLMGEIMFIVFGDLRGVIYFCGWSSHPGLYVYFSNQEKGDETKI